jgi:hypothetical protein
MSLGCPWQRPMSLATWIGAPKGRQFNGPGAADRPRRYNLPGKTPTLSARRPARYP